MFSKHAKNHRNKVFCLFIKSNKRYVAKTFTKLCTGKNQIVFHSNHSNEVENSCHKSAPCAHFRICYDKCNEILSIRSRRHQCSFVFKKIVNFFKICLHPILCVLLLTIHYRSKKAPSHQFLNQPSDFIIKMLQNISQKISVIWRFKKY